MSSTAYGWRLSVSVTGRFSLVISTATSTDMVMDSLSDPAERRRNSLA